jgi:hypothetical protein
VIHSASPLEQRAKPSGNLSGVGTASGAGTALVFFAFMFFAGAVLHIDPQDFIGKEFRFKNFLALKVMHASFTISRKDHAV